MMKDDLTYNLNWLMGRARFGMKPGLERIALLYQLLGSPLERSRIIHIAGSNGKGSTAAFIASIFMAHGFTVGRFTSPHLIRFNERIMVNDISISDDDLNDALVQIRILIERNSRLTQTTFFEIVTAVAFYFFSQQSLDLIILECGLGGRFDATNAISSSLAVITALSLEHQDVLGYSLTSIAKEKLGILKPGKTLVSHIFDDEIVSLFKYQVSTLNGRLKLVGRDLSYSFIDGALTINSSQRNLKNVRLALKGKHQAENAALAYLAASEFSKEHNIVLDERLIRKGLSQAYWPGRFDRHGRYIVDGAHNPAGIRALCQTLCDENLRPHLIFATLKGKASLEMLKELKPYVGEILLTQVDNNRAADAEELMRLFGSGVFSKNIVDAFERSKSLDGDILITGSIYLAGEALAYLKGQSVESYLSDPPLSN